MGAGESKSMRFVLMEDLGKGVVLPLVELLPGVGAWTGEGLTAPPAAGPYVRGELHVQWSV